MIKKIIKILLVVIWTGIIFSFSSDNGTASTKKSDSVIIDVYKIFNKEKITKKQEEKIIAKVVLPVRKLAHFTEYFILGLLIISLLSEFYPLSNRMYILAIALCLLYASSDEIHQLFVPGRSAKVLDVLIDTIGSSIGILLYKFVNKFRRSKYE